MKSLRTQVTNLSPDTTRTLLSVPLEGDEPVSSMATLYAELHQEALHVVGVQLVAELLGTRQIVATAGIPPGFAGIAALATGIVADAWHVDGFGNLQKGLLDVKLGIRQCCSGHRVMVPAALQQDVPQLVATLPAQVLPLNRHEGDYRLIAGDDGIRNIPATQRILRVVVTAGAAPSSVSGLSNEIWHIPANMTVSAYPRGNLEGPRSLNFIGTIYYQVELVS